MAHTSTPFLFKKAFKKSLKWHLINAFNTISNTKI
nr:MAG TPA: hypothetical protein [Caudoviricetes sp.]